MTRFRATLVRWPVMALWIKRNCRSMLKFVVGESFPVLLRATSFYYKMILIFVLLYWYHRYTMQVCILWRQESACLSDPRIRNQVHQPQSV